MKIFDVKLNEDQTCNVTYCLDNTNIKFANTEECSKYIFNFLLDVWNTFEPEDIRDIKACVDVYIEELIIHKAIEIKIEEVQ